MLSCEFCEIFKNIYFIEYFQTTDSVKLSQSLFLSYMFVSFLLKFVESYEIISLAWASRIRAVLY